MSFKIQCNGCGQKIEVSEEWIGKEGECPSCNKLFVISGPEKDATAIKIRPPVSQKEISKKEIKNQHYEFEDEESISEDTIDEEKIYQEEKIRYKAKEKLKKEQVQKNLKGCMLGCLSIFILMTIPIGLLLYNAHQADIESNKNPERAPQSQYKNKSYSSSYKASQKSIDAMNKEAVKILRKQGIYETETNIEQGIMSLYNKRLSRQKYSETISIYCTLRLGGMSHDDAIQGIKEATNGLLNLTE